MTRITVECHPKRKSRVTMPVRGGRGSDFLIIAACCGGTALLWANSGAVLTLQRSIGQDLQATQVQLQWATDIYPLVLATLVLPAGVLIDHFGRRRGMLIGLAVLLVGELGCGLASSADGLLVARATCGVGAAVVFPATLATLTVALPADRQRAAIGLWSASAIVGSLLGIFGTAVVVDFAWWGSAFLVLAGLTVACGWVALVGVPETFVAGRIRLDHIGVVLSIAAVGGIVYSVTEGPVTGWGNRWNVAALSLGIGATILFVVWELRTTGPMIDLNVFRDRSVLGPSIAIFVFFGTNIAVVFLLVQVREYAFASSPLAAVAVVMPGGLGILLATAFGSVTLARAGPRLIVGTGFVLAAGGVLVLLLGRTSDSVVPFLVGAALLLAGTGMGGFPCTQYIVNALPRSDQGIASALNDILRELGVAVGIAFLSSAFNLGYRHTASVRLRHLGLGSAARATAEDSPSSGLRASLSAGGGVHTEIEVIRQSFVTGWEYSLIMALAVLVAGGAVAVLAIPSRRHSTIEAPARPSPTPAVQA